MSNKVGSGCITSILERLCGDCERYRREGGGKDVNNAHDYLEERYGYIKSEEYKMKDKKLC